MAAHGWTIAEACQEFERAGLPVDEARFRMAIRAVQLKPVGETRQPAGSKGGRGQARYEIGQLQRLHRWYLDGRQISAPPSGGT